MKRDLQIDFTIASFDHNKRHSFFITGNKLTQVSFLKIHADEFTEEQLENFVSIRLIDG